jgi:haloalkane dehalogenase
MTCQTPGHRPAWVDDELFPFASKFLAIDGHTIHYVDEGQGPLLVLYHGNPTWSFLYRQLIVSLRHRFRCVAFDYPGMGLSSADPAFSYRAAALSDVAEHVVDALNLRQITVMVHDWGGPIGLGAAARHPDRYRAVIIGNTWAWPAHTLQARLVNGAFSTLWGRWPGRLAVEHANAFPRVILPAGHRRTPLTEREMQHYLAPFRNPAARRPCHVLPREIMRAKQFLSEVEVGLGRLAHLPTLIIWADRDFAFRKRELARWESIFPDHQTHVLHGAGHFFQDDAAAEMSSVLANWMLGKGQPVSD